MAQPTAYARGFLTKCAEHGVDPEQLLKEAARGDQLLKALTRMLERARGADDVIDTTRWGDAGDFLGEDEIAKAFYPHIERAGVGIPAARKHLRSLKDQEAANELARALRANRKGYPEDTGVREVRQRWRRVQGAE
jgi:hypothetical protein